jgi:hypothetical protein
MPRMSSVGILPAVARASRPCAVMAKMAMPRFLAARRGSALFQGMVVVFVTLSRVV